MTGPPPDNYSPYGGYEPSPGEYPPYQGGGYPPPQPQQPYGYPAPGGGYPPGGYPPPGGGYPPPGGGYPPSSPQPYGAYPPHMQYGQAGKPSNYLVWSIITIFLCTIPGIVATVYAARVDGLWGQGRYAEATSASNTAKTWAIVASVLGGLMWLAYLGRLGSRVS
ncbi:CD225/dispanin family protein [Mycobacterium asiaticum]|uniref:CD225/dispanin family protein n=1 Tax=Mycobacterium asiaticum TaxID=1790 RepID=UPI000A985187|nr:CD225/dispanin family protein [Mycobacterium asiaticum]